MREQYELHGCDIPSLLQTMMHEQREHQFSKFGDTYIKYRKVVAEWMIEVSTYFNLHATTTHAAISYLDRLQPNEKFSRFEWQMLAICCILIASKYNECEEHVPDLQTLEDISQQKLSKDIVLNYELWALKRMGWKLNARTPTVFLASYLQAGIVFEDDVWSASDEKESMALLSQEGFKMSTACILDASYKRFLASDVACAITYVLRRRFKIRPVWRVELGDLTQNDPSAIETSEIIARLEEQFVGEIGGSGKENDATSANRNAITPSSKGEKNAMSVSPDSVANPNPKLLALGGDL